MPYVVTGYVFKNGKKRKLIENQYIGEFTPEVLEQWRRILKHCKEYESFTVNGILLTRESTRELCQKS